MSVNKCQCCCCLSQMCLNWDCCFVTSHQPSAQTGRTRHLQNPPPPSCTRGTLPEEKVNASCTLFSALECSSAACSNGLAFPSGRCHLQLRPGHCHKMPRGVLGVPQETGGKRQPWHRCSSPQQAQGLLLPSFLQDANKTVQQKLQLRQNVGPVRRAQGVSVTQNAGATLPSLVEHVYLWKDFSLFKNVTALFLGVHLNILSIRIEDPDEAQDHFIVARSNCKGFAFVHIAYAQFEATQGKEAVFQFTVVGYFKFIVCLSLVSLCLKTILLLLPISYWWIL